jgi:hypothetical protein
MRKLILLATITALVAGMAAVPAAARSDNRCFGVQGSAETFFDGSGFTGIADFKLGGIKMEVPATAVADVPGLTPLPNGWMVTGGSHILDFGDYGTLITEDEAILVPTGPGTFSLRSRLVVTDGGSGKLHLLPSSTLDLSSENPFDWSASWHMRGQVCFDQPS